MKIDFAKPVHVHFIGIGGISMSGLAEMLKSRGFTVTGSDRDDSEMVEKLRAAGIEVHCPQCAENITRYAADRPVDLVVYTAAIRPDNPEYAAAAEAGIPMMTRAELLGQIMAQYPVSVAVAGTHGKTTTTAMISGIFLGKGGSPTISVGAAYPQIGGNYRIGADDTFIAEACEYTNSFLSLSPFAGVILNIEADHLDFFKDLADIRASFRRFAAQVSEDGVLVIGADIPDVREITDGIPCRRVITFGLTEDADVYATDITHAHRASADAPEGVAFTARFRDGSAPIDIAIPVPGDHNIKNALAAIAATHALGVGAEEIRASLARFTGASRRFERLGVLNGVTIVDDYAHHPTEIRATLAAARSMGYQRIWCAFQPHTYSRTKALLDDFAEALSGADRVVLADIYAAREPDNLGISSLTLRDKIRNLGHSCDYFPSFSEIQSHLLKNCSDGDLLIFMGAGEIDKIGYSMLSGT
ncbi:MAG: UDP-N-acetylmuramate--L-alanine ligase [Lachnospiraceae bacterium]|nr:UDP-N-acetylmuramate--L-alanine ligase [Lachnospiraceae bacterium]